MRAPRQLPLGRHVPQVPLMRAILLAGLLLALAGSAQATDLVTWDPPGDGWRCGGSGPSDPPLVVEVRDDCSGRVACEELATGVCE